MKQNIGKTVSGSTFYKAVDQAFGKNASKRLTLGCDKNGNLVDIFINLPKQIPENAALADLIQQAPEDYGNRCGKSFKVDAIGYSR